MSKPSDLTNEALLAKLAEVVLAVTEESE